jgi:glycosyltransferase involved in cell wall biosynthesis
LAICVTPTCLYGAAANADVRSSSLIAGGALLPRQIKNILIKLLAVLPPTLQRFAVRLYLRHAHRILRGLTSFPKRASYRRWIKRYDTLTDGDHKAILAEIESFTQLPLISLVVPVFNPPETYLRAMLGSVLLQLYRNWELCLADDASTAPHVARLLTEHAAQDPRIRVVFRPANGGISAASNSAIDIATGEFIAFLDHDDVLPLPALYRVAREINRYPAADLLYSDEDKITPRGRRYDPHFKSDWNPDLFLSQNMISHLGVYRAALVRRVGGLRSEFDGSQDYDLALRVIEETSAERIRHIRSILYHWRAASGSTARYFEQKPGASVRAQNAVEDHLRRRGVRAEIVSVPGPAFRAVYYALDTEPRVSVIIPTRDCSDLLSRCVRGILEKTDYRNLEVMIIDNLSEQEATRIYLEQIGADPRVRILQYQQPFNFSLINNWAANQAGGDILLFLNNDTEPIGATWLRHMVVNACRQEVGAVGAKLLYPNDRVQHGGVILGLTGVAGHFHRNRQVGDAGYFGRALLQQNLSAVTAACLATRRDVFFAVGGFDSDHLPIAFNDVDLCLKLRERGYLVVWTPLAQLYHHETASRDLDLTPERYQKFLRENNFMRSRWGHILDCDPYFNPNLSLRDLSIGLAFPPRWATYERDTIEQRSYGDREERWTQVAGPGEDVRKVKAAPPHM